MEVECAERSVDRRQFCVVQTVHNVHTKGRATGKAIGTSFRTGESVENGTSELA